VIVVASAERLRVLNVITHLDAGGATDAALNACAYISDERFAAKLVCGPSPEEEGDVKGRADRLGVEVVTIPTLGRPIDPIRDVRALRALRSLFRATRPDIVHTHSSKAGFLGRLAAHRERTPAVIHTVHGWSFHDYMPKRDLVMFTAVERLAARWTDSIVTVSELDRNKGLTAGIGSFERYSVIHELNDLHPFFSADDTPAASRTRLGLPADAPVIGTVGRLSDQKDPTTFVQTAAAIAAEIPEARFVMVGHGRLRRDVERLVGDLGLSDRFLLTGVRADIPAILRSFDVFLLTSLWEGMPLVIPQAMACRVPVVASTADGNRELIRDGHNGLLAPPSSPEQFAREVLRLLHEQDLRDHVVDQGSQTATAFTLARTIPQLESLYLDRLHRRNHQVTRK
jgi:glycosyltransferase involved in cell wall biosynthesis